MTPKRFSFISSTSPFDSCHFGTRLLVVVGCLLIVACGGSSGKGSDDDRPLASAGPSSVTSSAISNAVSSNSSSSLSSFAHDQMAAFVLPFDDNASGVTHQGERLTPAPAGKSGAVVVSEDGHFAVGAERIRFLGVNITASSAFTSHSNAEKVAQRLAKFGINLVRFHHMDNHFGAKSLINYANGNSTSLDPVTLDHLDYFIYQLKLRGIYVNLNLLNSREFSVADGLPSAIKQLSWKQSHVLGYVNDAFRNLEKNYANQLLSHKNPYTDMAYAEDPAVAFVEINNENGIFQQYYEGSLDQWPEPFATELNSRWNNWLSAGYESTAALESAWGAISEPLGDEKLANADFSAGITHWNPEQHDAAQASFKPGTYDGRGGLEIKITKAGSADWHVQFNQGNVQIKKNQLYTLGFWAKADSSRTLGVSLGLNYDPWSILESRAYPLTTSWQYFETGFIANEDDTNARINFNGFGSQLASVYLADISFKAGGALGQLPAGETLESRSISNNLRAQAYTAGRARDWAKFLRELETAYWLDMKAYVQQTLGVKALVTGTAVMNSPASVQAKMDFADAHAYWQHPQFPGAEWDAVNWMVENTSMVNTFNNTLSGLAKQRVRGIPFTVSEYQHASPNSYGSESPLLAAAYAGLQDWDGLIFFAYDAGENDNWGLGYFNDFFSMNAHPTKMANLLIAANLFRRGDVSPAQGELRMNFSPARELDILATTGSSWNVANGSHLGIPNTEALRRRISLDTSSASQGLDQAPAAGNAQVVDADTEQLRWDLSIAAKGIVTVNTPNTKALVGFIENRTLTLGNVMVKVMPTNNNWATVALTAQSGSFAAPDEAANVLVIATGNTENTNMQWTNSAKNSVSTHWGSSPTLVEIIPAVIDLPFAFGRSHAWILDETGKRKAELPLVNNDGKARLVLDGTSASLWYELVVDAAQ